MLQLLGGPKGTFSAAGRAPFRMLQLLGGPKGAFSAAGRAPFRMLQLLGGPKVDICGRRPRPVPYTPVCERDVG